MASEKLIKGRVIKQVEARGAQVDRFVLNLERFLKTNVDDILDKLRDGKTSGVEAASVLGGLMSELKAKGLSKEVAKIKLIYAEELRDIRNELEELGFPDALSAVDRDVIDALIDVQVSKVDVEIARRGIDMQAIVMNQVIAGETIDAKAASEALGTKLATHLQTEVNTAVMAFNRTVTAKKAEDLGLNLFLYVGPDDKVTRPFCGKLLDRVPAIYTKEEIEKLNNKQGLSVMNYGGGYNCRHHWRAITEKLAGELKREGGASREQEKEAAPQALPSLARSEEQALYMPETKTAIRQDFIRESGSASNGAKLKPENLAKIEERNAIIKSEHLAKTEGNTKEVAWVLDSEGNEILRKVGKSDRVSFDWQDTAKMRGAILNHNHPNSSAFSIDDLKFSAQVGLSQIRASVAKNPLLGEGEFILENLKPGETWSKPETTKLVRDFNKFRKENWTTSFIGDRDKREAWADLELKRYEYLEKKHPIRFSFERKRFPVETKPQEKKKQNLLG